MKGIAKSKVSLVAPPRTGPAGSAVGGAREDGKARPRWSVWNQLLFLLGAACALWGAFAWLAIFCLKLTHPEHF